MVLVDLDKANAEKNRLV